MRRKSPRFLLALLAFCLISLEFFVEAGRDFYAILGVSRKTTKEVDGSNGDPELLMSFISCYIQPRHSKGRVDETN